MIEKLRMSLNRRWQLVIRKSFVIGALFYLLIMCCEGDM